MIYIDRYAYSSKLKKVDPVQKLVFAVAMTGVCLWANNPVSSVLVIAIMGWVTVTRGTTPLWLFTKLLTVPMFFLMIGVLAIAFNVSKDPESFVLAIPVGGIWIGASEKGILQALYLFCKAMGAAACLYYLSLSTPVVDLLSAMRRLKVPKLFVELMGLMYRFIFILLETADTMITAQNSRLGYSRLDSGYRSLGAMASTIFIRAYKRSDEIYTSLEARGYEGELNVLEEPFEQHWKGYIFSASACLLVITATVMLRTNAWGFFK